MLMVDPLIERLPFGGGLGCGENHAKSPLRGCDAVVEPRHALAGFTRRRRLEKNLVADLGGRSTGMVDLAEKARRQLDASGSQVALLLIIQECAFEIAVRCRHL